MRKSVVVHWIVIEHGDESMTVNDSTGFGATTAKNTHLVSIQMTAKSYALRIYK